MDKGMQPWQDLELGAAIVKPGNSREYLTGDWGSFVPVLDKEKCILCSLCWLLCPEMAYRADDEGFFLADLDYCKGCGICVQECPKKAIKLIRREK